MRVIGLLGPSKSGKTSLAHLVAHTIAEKGVSCAVVSIAMPIKRDLSHRFGIHHGADIGKPRNFGGQMATTYREACQFYGDMMRKIDPECFLRELWHTVRNTASDVVIIDDVRTEREVDDLVRNEADIFLIRRPELVQSVSPANAHGTERYALDAVKNPESKLWTSFDNDQPLDLAAHSLYESIRNI